MNPVLLLCNMKARVEVKQKAIELRKKGLTYKEIMEQLSVSKSNLSGWFKYINYTEVELKDINDRISKNQTSARLRASFTNRSRRLKREELVFDESIKIFAKYKKNPLFIIGVTLYWAEGGKRTDQFQFVNSDPEMIKFMVFWIENFLHCKKDDIGYRLYMHKIYNYENCEDFWAKFIGVKKDIFYKTIYKPTKHKVKKNPNYMGCLRLSVGGIDSLRQMKAFQKLLIEYYSVLMRP